MTPDLDDLLERRRQLLDAQAELRRQLKLLKGALDTHPLQNYHPTRPEDCKWGDSQWEFHQSISKVRAIFGANQSGKTTSTGAELAMHASGEYPEDYPREGRLLDGETRERPLILRAYGQNFQESINEVIWPKIRSFLPNDLRVDPSTNSGAGYAKVYIPNKCEIIFGTYGQQDESHAGTTGDFYLFDEPPDSENHFIEIVRGSMARRARIVLGMTDLSDSDWTQRMLLDEATKDLKERYKPFVVFLDIRDNPYIDEAEKEWWIKTLPEDQREARVAGKPRILQQVVFRDIFDPTRHVVPSFELPVIKDGETQRPDHWTLAHVVDPHDAKPPAMGWFAIFDPAQGGGLSKVFQVWEDWGGEPTLKAAIKRTIDIEAQIGTKASQRGMDPRFGAKKQSLTGQTIQAEWQKESRLQKYPMVFRLPPGDNLVYGHTLLEKMFTNIMPEGPWKGQPQFQIMDRCTRSATAYRRYRHKKVKDTIVEAVVDDDHKHFIDLGRYLGACRFRYIPQVADQTVRRITVFERAQQADEGPMDSPFFHD